MALTNIIILIRVAFGNLDTGLKPALFVLVAAVVVALD